MTRENWLETVELPNGIRELRLQRGRVNALNADFLLAIEAEVLWLRDQPDVKAIVLTSPFKVFSAGMDLKEAMSLDHAGQMAVVDALNRCYVALFDCPKPVVAAVSGPAIAGGFFFVLVADYRVGCDTAQGGLAEVRVGVDFPIAALEIARMMLDPNDFRRLLQTGQPYDAHKLLNAGVLDELVPQDAVFDRAVAAANKLAEIPAAAFAQVKHQMRGEVVADIRGKIPESRATWFNTDTTQAMTKILEGRT